MKDKLSTKIPLFSRFLSIIFKKSPLQKKAILAFLETRDDIYFARAENFAQKMLPFLATQNIEIDYVAYAYLKMCKDMLTAQIMFQKTGAYTCKDAKTAMTNVYNSETEMASYMYGLALSQFLWPNHYGLYSFFIEQSKTLSGVERYCEIGPGHGLFLAEAISMFPAVKFTAFDISPVSARISKGIVDYFTQSSRCQFILEDVNNIEAEGFDYIVMCEVLEHLDDPNLVLKKLHGLLDDRGHLFITTCANCPAIDHVYLYRNVDHIRRELRDAGYEILSELALPVGDYEENEWEEKRVGINYAAMLRKV